MKAFFSLSLVLVSFSQLSTNTSMQEERLAFQPPDWKVGDRWRVKVWVPTVFHDPETGDPQFVMDHAKAAESILDFVVLAVKEVYGENCFEIGVTYPRIFYQGMDTCSLYFRVNTRRLARSVITHASDDGRTREVYEDIPVDPSIPVWSLRPVGLIVPSFPEWDANSAGAAVIERAGNTSDGYRIEQKTVRDEWGKAMMCSFTRSRYMSDEEGRNATSGEEVIQEWESEQPWWTKARWVKEGNVIIEAELIKIEDVDIEPPPPPTQDPPQSADLAEEAAQETVPRVPRMPLAHIIEGAIIVLVMFGGVFIVIRRAWRRK